MQLAHNFLALKQCHIVATVCGQLYFNSYNCILIQLFLPLLPSSWWSTERFLQLLSQPSTERGMRGGGLWEGGGKGAFSNWCTALSYKDNKKKKNRDNFLFPTMLTVAGIHYISVAGSDPTLNDIFKKFTFCKTLTRVWYRRYYVKNCDTTLNISLHKTMSNDFLHVFAVHYRNFLNNPPALVIF